MTRNYTPLDLSAVADINVATRRSETPEDGRYLRLPDTPRSTTRVRLLPAKAESNRPYAVYRAHRLAGKMLICSLHVQLGPNKLIWAAAAANSKGCPVCQYSKSMMSRVSRGAEPPDPLRPLSQIEPMWRVSWNVIARAVGDKPNVGPLVYSQDLTVAQTIWSRIDGDPSKGIAPLGDIFDPTSGRDYIIKKKPKGGSSYPDYSGSRFTGPCPAGTPEEWEKWMAGLHDLQPEPATYDQLAHALWVHLGVEEDNEGGFDTAAFAGASEHGG
jgi:hypothetical protein